MKVILTIDVEEAHLECLGRIHLKHMPKGTTDYECAKDYLHAAAYAALHEAVNVATRKSADDMRMGEGMVAAKDANRALLELFGTYETGTTNGPGGISQRKVAPHAEMQRPDGKRCYLFFRTRGKSYSVREADTPGELIYMAAQMRLDGIVPDDFKATPMQEQSQRKAARLVKSAAEVAVKMRTSGDIDGNEARYGLDCIYGKGNAKLQQVKGPAEFPYRVHVNGTDVAMGKCRREALVKAAFARLENGPVKSIGKKKAARQQQEAKDIIDWAGDLPLPF